MLMINVIVGVEVGATADKLFRQSNLLQQSGKVLFHCLILSEYSSLWLYIYCG